MFVWCECCVLSGRGFCDGLVTRPEEANRLWRVVVCDQETSKTRRELSGSIKCGEFLDYLQNQLASQEGLCSMEWVSEGVMSTLIKLSKRKSFSHIRKENNLRFPPEIITFLSIIWPYYTPPHSYPSPTRLLALVTQFPYLLLNIFSL
jgi:hypothetical protein